MTPQDFDIATLSAGSLDQVTEVELRRFADLIYARTGIHVSPQKRTLLSNRLRRRLRVTGIADFAQYYDHLRRLRPNDAEWDAFLQEITTHETYLFRDEGQWDWFSREFLVDCDAKARAGQRERSLRIWSAACSTGDEAVTAACAIAACLPNFAEWKIQILGTDIGIGALQQAAGGVFNERAMHLVPEDYRRRYFTKMPDDKTWRAKPVLTAMIAYRQHNLMEPLRERPFDLVLLKNVLIYFDAASKKTVVGHVSAMLRSGGLLVSGAAEGIADVLQGYRRMSPWLHQKLPR